MYTDNPQVWIAFGLYLAITFGLAYLAHRRASKGRFMEECFVAGREIGPWVLGLTWIATAARSAGTSGCGGRLRRGTTAARAAWRVHRR